MLIRTMRYAVVALFFVVIGAAVQPAWATLPTPNQPILVVQDSASSDPYQNFMPELLTTEGLNGFQTAQLTDLTASFLANYDVVILPHLTLTAAQATLFQNYVNAGGTLVGFRPDLQLANVFGVASLGTTLSEAWLKIDTTTAYGAGLDATVMKFHGVADLYTLSGATSLATLYNNSTTATASPAAAVYAFGTGKSVLFSFDLTQSNVLMRQGNPAWAGYPNNHDGNSTMRASQMFMDLGTGQYWNDLGDGALNDVPQADLQLRLFSNAVTLTNAGKRPLPRLWYFPNQSRSMLLMTADEHSYSNDLSNVVNELNAIQTAGGKDTIFLWYPYGLITPDQVNAWLFAGHAMGVHFDDTAEADASEVGGSAASWNGMQNVITNAVSSFAATYPGAPAPLTTRDHFLIWVSNNAAGAPDQTAQAKLFQASGIQLDTSYSAFPNRWGYMSGTGLPMKFLDPATGTIIPVYEQPTQYEDDVQLGGNSYSTQWDLQTAQRHYQKSLSDSLNKYNTVVTMLFHPDSWPDDSTYAQPVLDYAHSNSIPMYSAAAWLQFWQARAATTLSLPAYSANTLSFTATGVPDGLTVTMPYQSGNTFVTAVLVDGGTQNFSVVTNQGIAYAAVTLAAGTHTISATYSAGARILGTVTPGAAATGATVTIQGGIVSQTVPVASDGTFGAGPFAPATYTLTPSSSGYYFSPWSRSVTLNGVDVPGVNFAAQSSVTGQTLFTTQTPVVPNANDGTDYELGTVLQSDVPGYITGLRFWKAPGETGAHIGTIWSSTGVPLVSVTFTNETDSGWQQQGLPAPLSISANTPYIVSVNTAAGFYVASVGGLSSPVVNQDLSSIVGSNGLFGSPGTFPTGTFSGTNYFRDVFFTPSSGLISVSLNPATVLGGSTSTGTVLLSGPAPTGGATVSLSGDTGLVTMPASVTVPTGALGAMFTVTTQPVASPSTAAVAATYDVTRSTTLTIVVPSVLSVTLDSPTVTGGSGTSGTVALNGPAAPGGITVILSSDNGSATVPPSVTVAAGATTATFPVNTTTVGSTTTAAISATLGVTQAASLTINPPAVSTLNLNPSTVTGGLGSIGTVTLNDPAPAGGAIVSLLSDNATVTVPASVTIAAGATTATFSIATVSAPALINANISATYGSTATAVLTVTTPFVTNLAFNVTHLVAGTSSSGSVTISGPAPAGGSVVALTSDLPTVSEIEGVYSPADLPQGGSVDWASFGPEYTTISSGTVIPVTGIPGLNMTLSNAGAGDMESLSNCDFGGDCAWYGNFASGARILWVNGTYYSDTGWWAGNGPLTLQFDSPQRGIGFQAMSDENGPFTATVCAYDSSNNLLGCVPFTGNGTGVADGSAAFMGVYDDAREISRVVIDAGGTLYPHDFGISQLLITGARRTFIPSTVIVPAGTATASFPINAATVATPTTVNITASLSGTRVSSLTLDPAALASIIPAPSTVVGGAALTATITLTGKAPAGGAVVTLSADNPVSTGVQFVNSATEIPHDNTVTWTDLGPSFTSVASNTAVPIPGADNSTVSVSNRVDDLLYVLTNCPAAADCGFSGNFVPGSPLLWVDGSYDETGAVWTGDGPLTLRFSNPQRGVGFNIMADEAGPFSGTVCAYDSSDTLLGCKTYNGNGAALVGGTNGLAVFTGIYDDKLEIAKVTIDGGGALYPHDFAIGPLSLATNRRMVPQTVTVQAGASTATFPVDTDTVDQVTTVSIGGNYLAAQTGTLIVVPPPITSFTLNPSTLLGGAASTATLTFGAPVPTGAVVTISSNTAAAVVPASISVPEGATTATFTVTTSIVGAVTSAKLTASYGGPSTATSATLTINPAAVASVSFSPSVVLGGGTSTGTVTLNSPAPAGGAVIALSSDSAAAVVPASATVVPGDTTTTFAISTNPVGSASSATITATYNATQSAPLTINAPALSAVALNPPAVTGGGNSTGTVTLNGPAAASGYVVALSTDNSSATVPASVTVAAGATTATFTLNTNAVASVTTVTITGTANGTQTAILTINPPALSSVALNPTTVTGGTTSSGSVTLNGPAPLGGAAVSLSSDNGSATVPATVTVSAGATTATFTVNTAAVATATTATISANYNGSQTASLGINPPALASVSVNPATLTGGSASTGTVTLTGPAPAAGTVVTLSSDNSAATVPATVTVAPSATTATFTVNTSSVASAVTANISGAYNGNQSSAALTINPPALVSVELNPASLTGGSSSTGTVNLNTAAPAGGSVVALSSNNGAATLPASVIVAEGNTAATFTLNTAAVAAATPVTISGAYNGTQTASLTIYPPVLASVALNPTNVVGGNAATGAVTLNGPAPAAGATVTLFSDSGSATVSSSVTVAAGNTAANFTVNTLAVGTVATATISGTYGGTQSAPLTISPPVVSSVALNPATVAGGAASTGTITLSSPAPAGGAVVALSSDSPSATVSSSVTVAANATTATFTVNTSAVASITTANISAAFNGTQSAPLTINPPVLASVSVNPASVTGGGSSTGTVTLGSLAPAGGAVVTLSSNNGSATLPASVTVAAGATTATFTVSTTAVATSTIATIGGTLGNTQSASLTINPPTVSSVAVNPTSVVGGNSSTGTVTLNGPAPSGGMVVSLSSNNGAATVPASVTVAAGATAGNFTVNTTAVASITTATITGGTQTATLTISPAALSSVALNPTSVTGGTSSTGTVTLTGLAPAGGTVVTLSSNSGSATVPASVTVAAGASTANFTVNTTAVAATTTATITASFSGVNKTAALTVNAPAISTVSMNPASVTGGTSSTGTVTLTGPAPTGGIVVTLSDNSSAATTPASVTVLAGAASANFTDTTTAVGSATAVTITATMNGTANTTLTLNPPSVTSVAMNPTAVTGGASSTGTVALSGPAPTGGSVVTLSHTSSAATIPANVTVLAGATTANFTATTSIVGSTTVDTITATYNGSQTATLTINAPPVTGLTLLPTSVVGGNTSTGTVTILSTAPTGGVVVNLSSNNAAATVPANVTVAAGSKTANFTVTTGGVSSAATATITATENGTATANLTINPAALSAVSMSPATVTGGTSSTGTVTLTGFAPTGGIVVSLSDNNANATTPASVTVPAGSSSATFTVTTVGVSANTLVTITAIYNGVTKTATLTINAPAVAGVALNPTEVTGSQSSTGTVTLNSPAVGAGAVVSLSASGGSASVPSTVTVPAGATTANFTVTTSSVGASTSLTITATLNGSATATLTIDAPQVLSITLSPTTVKGGTTNSIATVTLNAPAAGNTPQRSVNLSSSNANAATVPASITFAVGQTSMQFTVTSKVVAAQTTSTISATMNGGTQTAVLTVTP